MNHFNQFISKYLTYLPYISLWLPHRSSSMMSSRVVYPGSVHRCTPRSTLLMVRYYVTGWHYVRVLPDNVHAANNRMPIIGMHLLIHSSHHHSFCPWEDARLLMTTSTSNRVYRQKTAFPLDMINNSRSSTR